MPKQLTIGLVVPFAKDELPIECPIMYPGVRFVPRGVGVRALTPEGYEPAWNGILPAADYLVRQGVDAIMVIGGADIYAQLLPRADRLEITRVHTRPSGDATFPPISSVAWKEVAHQDHAAGPDDDASFTILSYARADEDLY